MKLGALVSLGPCDCTHCVLMKLTLPQGLVYRGGDGKMGQVRLP